MLITSAAKTPATESAINIPIWTFLGVPPIINVVFKLCAAPPATAIATQTTPPISTALVIYSWLTPPVNLITVVTNNIVAIVIPETGLFDAPIIPTILAETTAKKKLNKTAMIPPTNPPLTIGNNQVNANPLSFLPAPIPPIACLKLVIIVGIDLAREINPPIATAPAPIYLI